MYSSKEQFVAQLEANSHGTQGGIGAGLQVDLRVTFYAIGSGQGRGDSILQYRVGDSNGDLTFVSGAEAAEKLFRQFWEQGLALAQERLASQQAAKA